MESMKFGIAFSNIGRFVEPTEAVRLAQAAEASGFDSIWTVDHVVVPAGYRSKYPYDPSGKLPSGEGTVFPDPLIWLAYVAAGTSTLRLGTGILIVPQRNPLVLAKELATLDYLSGGRMILGAGVGWLEEEFEALGVPFTDAAGAPRRPSVPCGPCGRRNRPASQATRCSFHNCCLRPQPPDGTIPVHVGGHSEPAARRAGRIGDGFFPFGVIPRPTASTSRRHAVWRRRGWERSRVDRAQYAMQRHWRRGGPGRGECSAGARCVCAWSSRESLFGEDFQQSLGRYGEDVIGRMR